MSKKKKKKKYYQQAVNPAPAFAATSEATPSASVAAPAPVAATAKPAVVPDKSGGAYSAHEEEYRTVRSDLIRVALVNGVFLAAVLALYYANKSNPFLNDWYSKIF